MSASARYMLFMMFWPGFLSFACVAGQIQQQDLMQDLLVTAAAHRRLQSEFDAQASKGLLNGRERIDFSNYLDDLARRVAGKCGTLLARYPEVESDDLPCAAGISAPLPAPVVNVAAERTAKERVGELDVALAEGLADFDEMLLREQQKIGSRPPRSRAPGGGAREDAGGGEDAGDESGGADGVPAGRAGGASQSTEGEDGAMQQGAESRTGTRTRRQPEAAASGSGDDVVARQLREAAEREQDPELREKLWEEYRRYKASTGKS